ncbi:MAG TPA: hypothetical protein VKX16_01985 [Chloroflexota bacterium]|nr:hypothetical protein [Chloroflexota bacterium]
MLIFEFEWDDANLAHLAERGLAPDDVEAMLESRITVWRNKRSGSGEYKFIGLGRAGVPLTIVVARTAVSGRWRPVTGRRSTDAERRIYER